MEEDLILQLLYNATEARVSCVPDASRIIMFKVGQQTIYLFLSNYLKHCVKNSDVILLTTLESPLPTHQSSNVMVE